MSKTWYPIIDYKKCTGCLVCYNMCQNGVYELNPRTNKPKVVYPKGCCHGCHGCGNKCKAKAIRYFGDKDE